jgi:hypothetical protein
LLHATSRFIPCGAAPPAKTLIPQAFSRHADGRAFPAVSYLRKRLSQLVGLSTFFLATM